MNRKFLHTAYMPEIQIQGKRYATVVAKIKFLCIHCLEDLRRKDSGLMCTKNDCHYGFILKKEAIKLTQEERFMKISKMFPSEYIRGIDVLKSTVVAIESVVGEKARNRDSGELEQEYVMKFVGMPKKLRLNITMAKAVMEATGDQEGDSDNWAGKRIAIYRTSIKAFGKMHIVPRLREIQRGDYDPAKEKKSVHWADDQANRRKLEKLLDDNGISLASLFWAHDVENWSEMTLIDGNGKAAYLRAKEWQAERATKSVGDLEDIANEAQAQSAHRTPEERATAIEERTNLLRGEVEEVGIGDDLEAELQAETDLLRSPAPGQEKEQEPTAEELAEDVARINELEAFASEVISKLPYFQDRKEVYDAMYLVTGQAPEEWDLDDTYLADLGDYASKEADARTEGEVEQDKLFS